MGKLEDSYIAFNALRVLTLVRLAIDARDDTLWFVRSKACFLRLPSDPSSSLDPARVVLGKVTVIDDKPRPRVEVLELHDRVFKELLKRAGQNWLEAESEFGIIFNIDGEFQLRLFRLPYRFKEPPRPKKLYVFGPILEDH